MAGPGGTEDVPSVYPRPRALMTSSSRGRDRLHVRRRIAPRFASRLRQRAVSGRPQHRLRQRRQQIGPLTLDAMPVLRDEARKERGEAREPRRRVASGGERHPEEHIRVLLRDARVAPLGLAGAAADAPRDAGRRARRTSHPASVDGAGERQAGRRERARASRSAARTPAHRSWRPRARPGRRSSHRRSARTPRRVRRAARPAGGIRRTRRRQPRPAAGARRAPFSRRALLQRGSRIDRMLMQPPDPAARPTRASNARTRGCARSPTTTRRSPTARSSSACSARRRGRRSSRCAPSAAPAARRGCSTRCSATSGSSRATPISRTTCSRTRSGAPR